MQLSFNKAIAFICSKGKCKEEKLAYKIANHLASTGKVSIGDLTLMHQDLPDMKDTLLIFINDCKSSCVKIFTNQLDPEHYVYVDVSEHKGNPHFNISEYVSNSSIMNRLPVLADV